MFFYRYGICIIGVPASSIWALHISLSSIDLHIFWNITSYLHWLVERERHRALAIIPAVRACVSLTVFRYIYGAQHHGGQCDRETCSRRGLPQVKWDQCHCGGGYNRPGLIQGAGGSCYYCSRRAYSGLNTTSHSCIYCCS